MADRALILSVKVTLVMMEDKNIFMFYNMLGAINVYMSHPRRWLLKRIL